MVDILLTFGKKILGESGGSHGENSIALYVVLVSFHCEGFCQRQNAQFG